MAHSPSKRNVLGVLVDALEPGEAADRVMEAARRRQPLSVSALAVHGVMCGVLDREHRARLNALDLVVPDGQPVRWALNNLHRLCLRERVYGPQLMLDTCERAAREQLPIFLYGSTPKVLAALQPALERRFPGLQIAGTCPSAFAELDEESQRKVATAIRDSGAAIVYVGLGCPRQETFCWAMRDAVGVPLLAVGAAFDFHAGLAREAPMWMKRRGLQWLHRLAADPRRLWKRYVLLNPLYLTLLAAQKLRLWRPVAAPAEPAAGQPVPG